MAQPSVASFFNSRKRAATDELRNKAKVQILDNDNRDVVPMLPEERKNVSSKIAEANSEKKKEGVVRNLQLDFGPTSSAKSTPRAITRAKRNILQKKANQPDIRESFSRLDNNVPFIQAGNLSPKKTRRVMKSKTTLKANENAKKDPEEYISLAEQPILRTPTKTTSSKAENMSLDEIKKKVSNKAHPRRAELMARIAKFKELDQVAKKLECQREESKKNPSLSKFDSIEVEVPASPSKLQLTPKKLFTPTKAAISLSPKCSPQRRLLFEPKEESPTKFSPTKVPAYQRYQTLIESKGRALPFKYRVLVEFFEKIELACSTFHNRGEIITFDKIQKVVRNTFSRNFTLEHLAQICAICPKAFTLKYEKVKTFESTRPNSMELIITPMYQLDAPEARITTQISGNRINVFKSVLEERVMDHHEKFLLSLENPMRLDRSKIKRWHAEFDLENCPDIEKAELPKPPEQNFTSVKDTLESAKKLCLSSRMQKAVQHLASTDSASPASKINSSALDTPPPTPKTGIQHPALKNNSLKGLPLSLIEKIRAKERLKNEARMTMTQEDDKQAVMYARLPELAKIVRCTFLSKSKNVLSLDFVIEKLDNSFRTKLTAKEFEEHLKLMCKILPKWLELKPQSGVNYLRMDKNFDMDKVYERLNIEADKRV